jgi:hypothetical protein
MVVVAAFAARVGTGPPAAKMAETFWPTSSLASAGRRSSCPSAERLTMVRLLLDEAFVAKAPAYCDLRPFGHRRRAQQADGRLLGARCRGSATMPTAAKNPRRPPS